VFLSLVYPTRQTSVSPTGPPAAQHRGRSGTASLPIGSRPERLEIDRVQLQARGTSRRQRRPRRTLNVVSLPACFKRLEKLDGREQPGVRGREQSIARCDRLATDSQDGLGSRGKSGEVLVEIDVAIGLMLG